MITVLTGSNDYEITSNLALLREQFAGDAEVYAGDELTSEVLIELTRGATLFAKNRLVVIKSLSANKELWAEAENYFSQVADSIHVVLVEPGVDKRSKTYKWLQKNAEVRAWDVWSSRDSEAAIRWTQNEATKRGLELPRDTARALVQRAGVDQWRLIRALEKLELVDTIDVKTIERIIEPHLEENVFELLGSALSGEKNHIRTMVEVLSKTDDVYRVFALLSSQIIQLSALVFGDKPAQEVATELGASPYVLIKLAKHTQNRSKQDVKRMLMAAARADMHMKQSNVDPWLVLESLLLELAETK